MRRTGLRDGSLLAIGILLAAVVLLAAAGPATAQEQPRAEAGLDQEVTRGATVLLDATESWSPAGTVVAYNWTITSPLNETVEPACEVASCRLANFSAPEMGTYEVQLTVEDERNQTATDTMYVETAAANEFDVELSGPDAAGDVTLTADLDAGNATLQWLNWVDSDGVVANESLSGLGGTYEFEANAAPGETYAIAVKAADGRVVGDTWTAPITTGSSPREYPYIEGPTELAGDAAYDDDRDRYVFRDQIYRVVTRNWFDAEEVRWFRDGETIDSGRIYKDDFEAGEHRLRATVTYADLGVDFSQFDQVPGDVSKNLGAIFDDGTAEATIIANPKPQFHRSEILGEPSGVTVRYRIEEPYRELNQIVIKVNGETVYSRENNLGKHAQADSSVEKPAGVEGRTSVTIVATDINGQVSKSTGYVTFPESTSTGRSKETNRDVEEMAEIARDLYTSI